MRPQKNSCRIALNSPLLTLWAFSCLLCAGCGQKTYEERLQQTREFYEYLQSVEANLASPAWIRPDMNLSMRLPKPFQAPMPGPEVFKDAAGEEVLGPDPRQQNVLGMHLPGLVEGWEASLDQGSEEPDAWIYVMTNHDRFLTANQGGPPPETFLTDLENDLMRVFQVTIPEGETSQIKDNSRYRAVIPAKNSARARYTTPKDYTVIRFVPDPEYNQADLAGMLYERRAGDIQAALLVVTRKSTGAAFRQRLDAALETLEVGDQKPARKKGSKSAITPPSRGGSRSRNTPNF